MAQLTKNNFASVEQMLAEVKVSGQGERFELLSLQGAVAFMDGKMAVSVTHFEKAAAIAPLREGDSFTMAMALVKLGDDKRARVVLTDLAQAHPRRPLYLYWLGRLDYDQRRYEEAIQKLQQASELDSKSARIWDSLGLAFDMQGRMEKALAAFRKAVDLNRTETHPSPWPPHNLGFLLLRMDQPQQAETALRESLRYNSNLAQSHYHLGRALEKEGRDSEAIEEYRSAVRSDTTSTDACYSLAMLYRKLHRDSDANTMFAEYKKRRQTPTVQ